MKNKSLKVNAFLNGFKTFLNFLFPLITFPYISRVLSVEEIGKYNFSNSIISYFLLLAALGIDKYAIREGAKYRENKERFSSFASEIFSFNIVSTLVSYSLLFLFILFSKKQVESIASTIKYTNSVFNSFVVGKTIDSLIIAIIFFIGSIILNLPYPMLFAIIIGITNMIPYFGPFIGAVPVVALTILINPIKGLWVLIFIVVLQQFDGVILGPRILGDSIGLKPIGVIFAIIVGGAIAGPLGMFFGVPIFSVIFTIFSNFVEKLYNSKNTVKNKLEKETKKDDDTEKSE